MKIERFIKEYANFQKQSINNCELMKEDIKEKALKGIDNIVKARERGFVTINETMSTIANIFNVTQSN